MSISHRIAFAVSASWFSRIATISLNLILIPILFRHMGQEELGLWFMLGQSGAFLGLMDLGVSPTLTRRIALAKGKSSGDPGMALTEESQQEIADWVASGRIIYRFMTLGVFLLAWTTGFLFIGQIELKQLDYQTVWIAWTVMCLSHAAGVWAAMWGCLLQGVGYVGWDAVLGTLINVATLCTQMVVVLLGGGLIALAVVATVGALITRFGLLAFIRWRQPQLFAIAGRWNLAQVKSMVSPALRAWLTGLGAFLILKTDQYFIAYFQGAADIPAYQAAYQLVSNLYILAVSFAIASSVFISHLWQAGDFSQIHRIVQRNLRLGLSIMACGCACFLLVGKELTDVWLGSGHFIGYPVLAVFCIMLFLEAQHVIVVSSSRATEDEAFALWALGAGVLNLLFTWLLIGPLGLLGVALGTMLAQLLTNNWYAVYRGLWRLKMSRRAYLRSVALPVLGVFLMAWVSGRLSLVILSSGSNAWIVLLTGIFATGFVLMVAIWFLVLDVDQRRRCLTWTIFRV